MEKNKLFLTEELHCHSIYSKNGHGKSTIEENVQAAIQKKLRRIYITDHGFSHVFFGMKRSLLPKIRREVDELQQKYPEIEIFLGVEANIISYDGSIDVTDQDLKYLDVVNLGWHDGVIFSDKKSGFLYHIENRVLKKNKKKYARLIEKNTDAMISAIQKNKIFMITHPGDKIGMNIDRLAKACEETGTMLEINNAHGHLSVEEIRTAMKYDVMFGVGSDAHHCLKVGIVDQSIRRILKSGLDIRRVYNLEEGGTI